MIVEGHDLSYIDLFREEIPKRPGYWCEKLFGIKPWPKQEAFMASVLNNRLTCVPTGHAVGKSAASSVLAPMWLLSHFPAFVIVTGADWNEVKRVVMLPMQHVINQSEYFSGFKKPGVTQWIPIPGIKWGVLSISPDRPEGAHGYHGDDGTLVMIDEASALDAPIYSALSSLLTGERDSMVMLGNPLRPDGPFADAIKSKMWVTINISSMDTPNYIEGKSVIPGLASRVWVDERRKEYGEGSIEWNSRILGLVPDQSEDTFIPVSLFESTLDRVNEPEGIRVMALDVAFSETGDLTFWLIRNDTQILHMEWLRGSSEINTVMRTDQLRKEYGTVKHYVDDIGVGHAIASRCKEEGIPNVIRVHGGKRAHNSIDYFNARAEMWARMKTGLKTLSIPVKYETQLRDMTAIKRELTGRKQMQLEDKKKLKARLNRSPDGPDALAMTYYAPVGDQLFPMIYPDTHTVASNLSLIWNEREWILRRTGGIIAHSTYRDDPGVLCRAIWHSRRDMSSCLWVHIDADGCWTVVRSYQSNQKLPDFISSVNELSQDDGVAHHYSYDVASASYGSSRAGDRSFMDVIHDTIDKLDSREYPWHVTAKRLAHSAGLDDIDKMLLSTLAMYPDHEYWVDSDDTVDLYTHTDSMLVFGKDSVIVLKEMEDARLKELGAQADEDDDKPEDAVGGGGGFVRCLRQLCVEGACYVSR